MKFKTKNDTEFFAFLDELCIKNQIEGPNSIIKDYDYVRGYMIIRVGEPFLVRLKAADKENYDLLVRKYGDI